VLTSDHVSENKRKKLLFGGWGGEILIELCHHTIQKFSLISVVYAATKAWEKGRGRKCKQMSRCPSLPKHPDENLSIMVIIQMHFSLS